LAYLTAKTNGLDELAAEILEAAGLTEADIDDVPTYGTSTLRPPPVVTSSTNLIWPSVSTGENFFDKALANGVLEGGVEPDYVNGDAAAAGAHNALDAWAKEEEIGELEAEEGGWDLDADAEAETFDTPEAAPAEEEEELGAGATPGVSEKDLWVRNSPLAADHVAAGSFETAMQVRQFLVHISLSGVVEAYLMPIFSFSRVNLVLSTLLPSNHFSCQYIGPRMCTSAHLPRCHRLNCTFAATQQSPRRARCSRSLQGRYSPCDRSSWRVIDSSQATSSLRRKSPSAQCWRRCCLLCLPLTTRPSWCVWYILGASNFPNRGFISALQWRETVTAAREYLLGVTIELERRRVAAEDPSNVTRNLELAAYFTHCQLQPPHLQIALRSAISIFGKANNHAHAARFAKRLVELKPDPKIVAQVHSLALFFTSFLSV
jgi:coatomer protein complex subunit alpha (xenin)